MDTQRTESLHATITALKSLVSEYSLRANQAEQLSSKLMGDLDQVKAHEVAAMIISHMEVRSKERSVHQQALIQATLVALTSTIKQDEKTLRGVVNTVVGSLTTALGSMNVEFNKPHPKYGTPNSD